MRIYRAEECRDRFNLLAHAPGFSFTFTIPLLIHVAIFLQKILSFCERLDFGSEIRCVVSRRASHYHADDFAESVGVGGLAVNHIAEVVIINLNLIDVEVEAVVVDEFADFLGGLLGDYDGEESGVQGYGRRDCGCVGGEGVVRSLVDGLVMVGGCSFHCDLVLLV